MGFNSGFKGLTHSLSLDAVRLLGSWQHNSTVQINNQILLEVHQQWQSGSCHVGNHTCCLRHLQYKGYCGYKHKHSLCYCTMHVTFISHSIVCNWKLSSRSAEAVFRLTCNTVPSSYPALGAGHYDTSVAIFRNWIRNVLRPS